MAKKLVAIDIGSTKTTCVIARKNDGQIDILGLGIAANQGMHRGVIKNNQKVAASITEAYKVASNQAGESPKNVIVNISGANIGSIRSNNYVSINNPNQEVSVSDLERLKKDIATIQLPAGNEIIHILIQEFSIDKVKIDGDNPIGILGTRLEASSHIVYAPVATVEQIKRAVKAAGLEVENFVLSGIASAEAVIDQTAKTMGVMLIDIGCGVSDVVVYHEGAVKFSKSYPIGGELVTNDIKSAFAVMIDNAELLKRNYGYAVTEAIVKDQSIKVQGGGAIGEKKIKISEICLVINYRMRELFSIIDKDISQAQVKKIVARAGIFLTGGGAQIRDLHLLAEEIFKIPANSAFPTEVKVGYNTDLESPQYSTVVGLLHYNTPNNVDLADEEVAEEQKEAKPEKDGAKSTMWNPFRNRIKSKKVDAPVAEPKPEPEPEPEVQVQKERTEGKIKKIAASIQDFLGKI